MITVAQAENIVLSQIADYGIGTIPFQQSLGRVLATPIAADRDMPPYNRVTVDGIAIRYSAFEKGNRQFTIIGTQAAGDEPINIHIDDECVEIMTGAALPETVDTVIRYEDILIDDGIATLQIEQIQHGQNIHFKGIDKKRDELIVPTNTIITPDVIGVAASTGMVQLTVKKLPRVVVISSGEELKEVHEVPNPYQIRRSNNYTVAAVLQQHGMEVAMLHLPDNEKAIKLKLQECINNYDVILLSGGISMGKFDYIPQALEALQVKQLLHKVMQRPGKPFWFGTHENGVKVFAFPGNPVSTFMCLHRYFLPWLYRCMGIEKKQPVAVLSEDFTFNPALQYFLQVKLSVNDSGVLQAQPAPGNGSGDYANLVAADAFMELPLEQNNFKKGDVYPVWIYKTFI